MRFRSILDTIALVICSNYGTIPLFWLVVHPFVQRWRRSGRRAYMFIVPAWILFIAAAFLLMWPFRSAHLYLSWWSWLPAALFFIPGFWIYRQALRNFHHSQLSGLDELEPQKHRQQLVTTGIRAHVRHPIYLGHVCELIAWCIGTGLVPLFFLTMFGVFTGGIMIRIEDRELETRFGEAYRSYRHRVPAVLPRLSR